MLQQDAYAVTHPLHVDLGVREGSSAAAAAAAHFTGNQRTFHRGY